MYDYARNGLIFSSHANDWYGSDCPESPGIKRAASFPKVFIHDFRPDDSSSHRKEVFVTGKKGYYSSFITPHDRATRIIPD